MRLEAGDRLGAPCLSDGVDGLAHTHRDGLPPTGRGGRVGDPGTETGRRATPTLRLAPALTHEWLEKLIEGDEILALALTLTSHPQLSPSALAFTLSSPPQPSPSPSGKARHLGVSNFNTHDLAMLMTTAEEPIDVLEAHFGVGLMDFEVRGTRMHMHMLRACPLWYRPDGF